MNQIYPEFSPIHIDRFSSGELKIEKGRKIRLHVTRETDYGDRYKLFVFTLPEGRDTHWGSTPEFTRYGIYCRTRRPLDSD
ncbi:MAG: hypothetical protein CM1200mP20_10320 [Pseudomonadota bacterium]|nr:MAG: hypothetical protein CM1200mP20_10320 [Pseudomonadota bacterium]